MIPGLFRTLVGLVVAWFVFRFLDRTFGRRRAKSPFQQPRDSARNSAGERSKPQAGTRAKDDDLGEYVDYEEVKGDE